MVPRRLVYLGPDPAAEEAHRGGVLLHEGRPLEPETPLELARRRSPWSAARPIERILIGSHPARADVLLEGGGLAPEEARIYVSKADAAVNDLKAVREGDVRVNGRLVDQHEWYDLKPGDELRLGSWRFRFEIGAPAEG